MMKIQGFLSVLVSGILLSWAGCSEKELPPTTAVYSTNGGTASHHNGEVCMSCHYTGGEGKYSFIVAGSVYKSDKVTPSPNGVLYFWSEQGGTGQLIATLQVDANGNFFTTASILPGLGAFPQMRGISGDVRTMPMLTSTGNCNSCHGATEEPIWIN